MVYIANTVHLHCKLFSKSKEVDLGPPEHLRWSFCDISEQLQAITLYRKKFLNTPLRCCGDPRYTSALFLKRNQSKQMAFDKKVLTSE